MSSSTKDHDHEVRNGIQIIRGILRRYKTVIHDQDFTLLLARLQLIDRHYNEICALVGELDRIQKEIEP